MSAGFNESSQRLFFGSEYQNFIESKLVRLTDFDRGVAVHALKSVKDSRSGLGLKTVKGWLRFQGDFDCTKSPAE